MKKLYFLLLCLFAVISSNKMFAQCANDQQPPEINCTQNVTVSAAQGLCNAIVAVPVPVVSDNCTPAEMPDQSNTIFDTYPGFASFVFQQSFTAGITGLLTRVECPIFNWFGLPAGVFSIYEGQSLDNGGQPNGILIYQQANMPINVPQAGGILIMTLSTPVHLEKNKVYLWKFNNYDAVNRSGQIGTQGSFSNPYPGGRAGTVNTDWLDIVFSTYMQPDPLTFINNFNNTADASGVYNVGTTDVIWTATDFAGNTATCTTSVTVNDDELPVINGMPANITSCGNVVSWTAPTASDNCGIQSFSSNYQPGAAFPQGATSVIYTATDIHGNTTEKSFTVTVNGYPDVQITGNNILCAGSPSALSSANTHQSYLWSTGATASSIAITQGGTYTLTGTDNGCSSAASITVTEGILGGGITAPSAFTRLGSATVSGNAYTLTNNFSQTGAVWHNKQLDLNYDFEIQFSKYQCGTGDGMMFVLQNAGTDKIGDGGSAMGYYGNVNQFPQSLGVEMDIYNSGAGAQWYDIPDNHISIVKNGSAVPLVNVAAYPLSNCLTQLWKISWNSITKVLAIYKDNTPVSSYTDDIVANIFGGNSKVYFGFTGATGGAYSTQTFTVTGVTNKYDIAISSNSLNCDAAAILSNVPVGFSWYWSNGNTSQNISVNQSGTYSLTATDNYGCSQTKSINVNVTPSPAITTNSSVTNLCPGTQVTLTASAGSNYSWSNGAITQSITVTNAGNYSVNVDGCNSNAVNVSYKPAGSITPGSYTTFCPGQSINLTASAGDSYMWSTGETTQTITVNTTGNYSVTITDNDGCIRTASQQVIVQALAAPVTNVAGNVTGDACGGYVFLYVTNYPYGQGYSFAWYKAGQSTPVSNSYYYYAYTDGDYFVIASRAGCSSPSSDTIHVTIPSKGDPGVFGNNEWNVYAWQDYNYYPAYPDYQYQGYYKDTSLSFDTRNKWQPYYPISDANGFIGCYTDYDYFKFSAKRKGFPCGHYTIDIPGHDDDAALYINGVKVWEHTGCCDTHTAVWEGDLGPNTEIEYTVNEYEANAYGVITFNLISSNVVPKPVIAPSGILNICSTESQTFTSSAATGNLWSNGETTQSITVNTAGNYSVTVTGAEGCTAASDEVTLTVTQAGTYYRDADNDGYGDAAATTQACAPPAGYVSDNTDCNDADATVHPGAPEVCDGLDNNCNGQIDEGVKTTFYRDADNDGYGDAAVTIQACAPPAGYVSDNTDCDDAHATVHPGAPEVCDGLDNNCNGQIDEGVTTTFYLDADNDGYGDANNTVQSCSVPNGYVTNNTDCNDNPANGGTAIHPGAIEICGNGIDDNCNGQIDEGCNGVSISIADKSMNEGNKGTKTMSFNVTLSKKSNKTIKVNYATSNGTATSGSDYVSKSGTLTFAPGTKLMMISITINGDKTAEADEIFTINLSNPVNAVIADATGTGTIINDDASSVQAITETENSTQQTNVMLLPNPASSIAYVNIKGYNGFVTIQLQNMQGKLLRQEKIEAPAGKLVQQPIDVSGYASGMYFVTIIDDKGNKRTEKLIVQH